MELLLIEMVVSKFGEGQILDRASYNMKDKLDVHVTVVNKLFNFLLKEHWPV